MDLKIESPKAIENNGSNVYNIDSVQSSPSVAVPIDDRPIEEALGKGYDKVLGGIEPTPSKESTSTRVISKEFDIKTLKDASVQDKVVFDFEPDKSGGHSFVEEPTNAPKSTQYAQQNQQGTSTSTPPPDYINPPIGGGGAPTVGQIAKSRAEFKSTAKTIIAVFDVIAAFGLSKLAGENSGTPYKADAAQKNSLEDAVVELLFEKQTKANPWVMILLAGLGAYGIQAGNAINRRMDIAKLDAQKKAAEKTKVATNPQGQQTQTNNNQSAQTNTQQNNQTQNTQNAANTTSQQANPSKDLTVVDNGIPPDQNGTVHFPDPKFTWQNPDPEITAKDANDLKSYVARDIYPKYVLNKGNKSPRLVVYKDGIPKMGGRPPKLSR